MTHWLEHIEMPYLKDNGNFSQTEIFYDTDLYRYLIKIRKQSLFPSHLNFSSHSKTIPRHLTNRPKICHDTDIFNTNNPK